MHGTGRDALRAPLTILACAVALSGCGGVPSATDVPAAAHMYTVGGTVSGLTPGAQLTLLDNGQDSVTVANNGAFAFPTPLQSETSYAITVSSAPHGQTCSIAGGAGTVRSANVANAVVTCAEQSFTLGGTVQGLNAAGLVLANGADTVSVPEGATQFAFPAGVAYLSSYAVTVASQPPGVACLVQAGSGVMPASALNSVRVSCTDQPFALGGTVSGLGAHAGLVLANGTDSAVIAPGATRFTMPQAVRFATPYAVSVQSSPANLQCTVNNASGTMPAHTQMNVAVVCAPVTYTVGGSLTGLFAAGLVLANAADTLSVPSRSGVFTMPVALPTGAHYDIVVQAQPSPLTCSVSDGSGTIGTAAVTDVLVSCGNGAHTLGGSISGLGSATGLVLANGADTLTVLANAVTFTLPTGVAAGAPYQVTVKSHPTALHCTVSNGSGVMPNTDVGNVAIACAPGTESVLYSLDASGADGVGPYGNLLLGADGSLYGLSYIGGANGLGAAFRLAPDGTETVLYAFAGGSDGANPHGTLVQGSDGNFYGVTSYGGTFGHGVAFMLTPAGSETVLYVFGASGDAQDPYGSLLQASDGNFYGLSVHGGANGAGALFMITPQGTESLLWSFGSAADGQGPFGSLIQGSDGALYGMTASGGDYGAGTVFRISLAGSETVLHSFGSGADGANPQGSLVQASDGNFYGLTRDGGANGLGVFFSMTPAGSESVLYAFGAGSDAQNPFGEVLQASDGTFYALTRSGGANNAGALVQLTSGGAESLLWSFGSGADGQAPYGSLVQRPDGALLGMTALGGSSGAGVLFEFD